MKETSDIANDKCLLKIFSRIYSEKGLDFTQYKDKMIFRRVAARMSKREVSSYEDYLKIVENDPKELDELVGSLSIHVTEFFRNPESFDAIKNIVIPRVIASKKGRSHKIIKMWSSGCSRGDEPYSLAMLLLEKLGDAREKFLITIIGSDIADAVLKEAKNWIYEEDALEELDGELVKKYFEKTSDGGFKLKSFVTSMVRFRKHDVINDMPFMHCDVILCRNLLIYFNKQLQEETQLKLFDCLNPGGFLVLGMTESLVGNANKYFETVENKLRIYRRPEVRVDGVDTADEPLSQNEIDNLVKDMLEG